MDRTVVSSPFLSAEGRLLPAYLALAIAGIVIASSWAAETASPVINLRNDGTGVYPDAKPPLRWKACTADPKGALWSTPLPGPAEISQPVIGDDRIFVHSAAASAMAE